MSCRAFKCSVRYTITVYSKFPLSIKTYLFRSESTCVVPRSKHFWEHLAEAFILNVILHRRDLANKYYGRVPIDEIQPDVYTDFNSRYCECPRYWFTILCTGIHGPNAKNVAVYYRTLPRYCDDFTVAVLLRFVPRHSQSRRKAEDLQKLRAHITEVGCFTLFHQK